MKNLILWVIFSSTGPLCLAFLVASHVFWSSEEEDSSRRSWLRLYAFLETVWWLLLRWSITHLDERPRSLSALKRERSRSAIDKLLREEMADADGGREFVSGWFFNKPFSTLAREDLLHWWSWVAANAVSFEKAQDPDQLSKEVDAIRKELSGDTILDKDPEEEKTRARCIRLTQDSLRDKALAKPLWLYALLRVGISQLASGLVMRRLGFRSERFGKLWFWIWRNRQLKDTANCPSVFIHGLGLGLFPYAALLGQFVDEARTTKRPGIIVPDLFYVALASPLEIAWRGGIPDADSHCISVENALRSVASKGPADFFVHSYGSVIASWLLKDKAHLIRALALAEPVSVLIHHARVARSFLYEPHAQKSLVKAIVSRAVATDVGVVHVLMRHFWWFENTIFIQDLHRLNHPPLLLLSAEDEYTPSVLIRDRLRAYDLEPSQDSPEKAPKVVWFKGALHGDVVLSPSMRKRYFDEFNALVHRCSDSTHIKVS